MNAQQRRELIEKVAEMGRTEAAIVPNDDEDLPDLIERVRVGLDQVLDEELSRHQQLHDELDAIEALLDDDHEPRADREQGVTDEHR